MSHVQVKVVLGLVFTFLFLPLICCVPKTELRHCVDNSGNVQPEQVCVRGEAGYQWVYGGEPDPDRPGRMINYSTTPSEGATVVSQSGAKN